MIKIHMSDLQFIEIRPLPRGGLVLTCTECGREMKSISGLCTTEMYELVKIGINHIEQECREFGAIQEYMNECLSVYERNGVMA